MNYRLLFILITATVLCFPKINFGQTPALGTAADFVLFSSVGAVSNTGITHLTGNVGTNSGSSTGFGNVDGGMHDGDLVSGQCGADLLLAYAQLSAAIPTFFPAPLLGSGQILLPGVYSIASPATLDLELILDGQSDPSSLFIIQIGGAFSTNANSKVTLINGALACHVFWKVEGLVDMAAGTTMRGTIVANNAAINMNSGDILEGRALSINGAITVNNILAYTPIGCGSPHLVGPAAPNLVSAACYALFSSDGPVANVGITNVTGDIGTNNGLTTGYNPLFVNGNIHPIPDGSTVSCASDLLNAYSYMNTVPYDIELLYPAQFGNSLVLTPHTYILNGAVTFTDTLFLNAEGDANAVFLIQINGALSTSTFSNVVLINGTQSKNVYWKVDGAVDINDFSTFRGTIVCNNGAMNLATGVLLDGRALTTTGALGTSAITVNIPSSCQPVTITQPTDQIACAASSASFEIIADGIGLTYQWRKGTVDLVNGGSISGANSSVLTINPVAVSDIASNYNVVIIGTYTPSDTSVDVSLTVNTAPLIIVEPVNQTTCTGSSANFTVTATGSGLTYQWRKGTVDISDGGSFSGANTNILTINPVTISDPATDYNVVVSGICSPNDTSIYVELSVNTSPVIITEPVDQIVCAGSSVSFDVTVVGTGLSYQWRKGTVNLSNGGSISGANSNTLTINPVNILDTAANYNVVVSGTCTPNDTSINVVLLVNSTSAITTQPSSVTACFGTLVSFVVAATGTGVSYQWRNGSVNLSDGGSTTGVNNDTLTINPVAISDSSSNYNVVISGACLPNDTSVYVFLVVNSAPSITTEPISITACSGSSVDFSVVVSGSGLTYQWRNGNVNLSDGGSISGANSDILTINPVSISDTSVNYNVVITGVCAPNDTSEYVTLFVNSTLSITTQPIDITACAGESVNFSVAALGAGLSYQWRNGNVNLVNGGSISGVNNDTLTINPVVSSDVSLTYNVVILGTCAPSDTSINVSLTVYAIPLAVASSNSPICASNSIDFAAGTLVGATYLWTGPNSFTSTIQNPTISSSGTIDSGNYSLTISVNGCSSVISTIEVVVTNCATDLSISKTAGTMNPSMEHDIVFTIVATNNGVYDATGVSVTEILQSGYTYISSTETAGTYDLTTGVWIIGAMTSETSETMTITTKVNRTGNYVNTAIIYGNEADTNMANNVSSIEPIPTDFFIPEGFSPNGDDINDLFVVRGILNYSNNTFDVFNRWGEKVYEAAPYKNTWDGKSTKGVRVGGDELPVGTYFYTLDLGDGSKVYKGTIYLNR